MLMIFVLLVSVTSIDSSYNIALNKTAVQSSIFTRNDKNWTADKAVDGNLNTDVNSDACSVTDDNDTISVVWWYVDLVETSRVSSVRIVYRVGYEKRLAGFSLFISENSDLDNGHPILCFKDKSNGTLPEIDQSMNCDVTGRYVTVYNERLPSNNYPNGYSKRAVLELCEVEVYGCPFGKFGNNNCDEKCSTGCRGGDCLPDNGTCVRGCLPGWKSQACDECSDGNYGELCDRTCSIGCLNSTCNKETGSCDERCKDNWTGQNCDVCVNGLYGSICSQNCSIGCNQTICDRADGSCLCREGWLGKTCNEKRQDTQAQDELMNFLPIILGAAAGFVVVTLIATVTIVVRRRRHMKNNQNDHSRRLDNDRHTGINGAENRTSEDICQNSAYAKKSDTNRPENSKQYQQNKTALEKLSDAIERKTHEILKEEFKSLPFGAFFPKICGEMENNLKKNRFKFIIPYDHSRVILKNRESDYINASYIRGVDTERAYIATQGPKKTTIEDFWSLVWQERTSTIVMLTNLIEVGKVKCEQYWPDDFQPLVFDFLQVKLQDEQTQNHRLVTQLHFNTWPDHGAADPLDLMLFHKRYQSVCKNNGGLPVIHCSAGIGRTGTFIAMDALLTAASKGNEVNILNYIEDMRQDRMKMIQTEEQYILLHEALLEGMDYHNRGINKDDFRQIWRECKSVKAVNQSRIELEFQHLNSKRLSYVPEIDCKSALSSRNRKKDPSNILPMDRYRPYIIPNDSTKSDYINAVIVPTHYKEKGFLVTHTPTEDTVYEFWCMVHDHRSSIVVILDVDRSKESLWFPRHNEVMEVDDLSLQSHNDHLPMSICLARKGSDETNDVQLFMEPECLPNKLPQKVGLLDLIEKVNRACNVHKDSPITVVCRDGASHSGLFCIIFNCITSLEINKEVDVYYNVRQCLKRRPEFCPSYEQYQYCYDIIMEYLDSSSIYVNQYL